MTITSSRPDRRAVLATLGGAPFALAAGPRPVGPDAGLKAVLDGLQSRRAGPAEAIAALEAVSDTGLSPAGRVERWSVLDGARLAADFTRRFDFGAGRESPSPYVVSPRGGAFTRLAALLKSPPGEARDAKLTHIAAELRAETARIRTDAGRGVVPPGFVVASTLAAMAPLLNAPADAAAGAARAALADQHDALERLARAAPIVPGVWRLKDGESWYAGALAINFGAEVSPRHAHAEALDTVARLRTKADGLLRRQGLSHGTVGVRLRALTRDLRWLYADSDEGRARAVTDMNARLDRARARLPELVREVPPAVNAVSVLRMTPEDAARGRAGYRDAPPFDGSRAGGYYVDLAAIRRRPAWTLPSVVHHELLPGHLLQIPLGERADPHPFRAQFTAAYSEAWGVYAEQLADEIGLYDHDPLARLGYLQWRLFRLGRLVTDTGIHIKRWSRERAIAELNEIQGGPIAFISIEEDVERMCVTPGQVAAQALGALRFHSLVREGGGDPRDVRSALLNFGPLPFATAERVVKTAV